MTRVLSVLVALALGVTSAIVPLGSGVQPAQALTAGQCSEASGTMVCNVDGLALSFSGLGALATNVNQSAVATNVFSSGAVQIDARVTITQDVGSGALSKSGNNLSVSIGTNETVGFRVDFFVNGSNSSALLRNVEVLVTDIDGGTQHERAEFSGLASYRLAKTTHLTAVPAGVPSADSETGTRVFRGGSTADPERNRWVSVLFEEVSSIGLKAFSEGSGGVVGFQFGSPAWGTDADNPVPVGDGSYTITYDKNGGSVDPPVATTAGRGDLTLSNGAGMVNSSSVAISSWNTAANGSGVTLGLGATYKPISNITLYAQYVARTVTFNANGGSGAMSAQSASGPTALASNAFGAYEGRTFAGWNTAADGSGAFYADGASFPFAVNRTLYAQWALPPVAPTALDGAPGSPAGQVSLTWTAPAYNGGPITGYLLEARPRGSGTFVTVSDVDGNLTDAAATVTGLNSCQAYDFRVSAINAAGTGVASATAGVTSFGNTGLTPYSSSAFILGGHATRQDDLITLTPDQGARAGALWSGTRFDLRESFCVRAEVKLSDVLRTATATSGADGIAFVIQPSDTTSLSSGGGLGYSPAISPSFAVEFDTYLNAGDVAQQEIALRKISSGTNAAWGPSAVDVTSKNIEDGAFHQTEIRFDAHQKLLTVLFDFNSDGDFSDAGEIVFSNVDADLNAFFATTDFAYWGFTAATGGETNLQQVRNIQYLPGVLSGNTLPTVTNPGSQSVAVGNTTTVDVALDDSNETSQQQWRLAVTSANTAFATASVSATSATQARISVTGVANGDTTLLLTATDADGASVSTTIALRVGAGSPAAAGGGAGSAGPVVVTPPAVVVPPRVLPRVLPTPPPVVRPVVQNGGGSLPPAQPTALVGGQTVVISTQVTDPNTMSLRAGVLNIGMNVPANQGGGVSQQGGTTELQVRNGGSAGLTGSGLLPRSTVQVFMPLGGSNSREIARIPVDANGSFSGDAIFGATPTETPLPIGRHVLQMVTVDENRQQTVVEMTVNIAQPSPAPEVNRSTNERPSLLPGQSIATNGGVPEAVVVTPIPDEKRATIQGDGWSMAVQADGDGGVASGEGGAEVTFVRDQGAVVSGEGFMPGTRADVWLFSDPTLLGTVEIDENGEFNGVVTIDGNVVTVGEHTLQLQGVGEDGFVRAANLGVNVMDEAPALTEESSGSLFWLWMLVLLGVVSVAAAGTWLARRARV